MAQTKEHQLKADVAQCAECALLCKQAQQSSACYQIAIRFHKDMKKHKQRNYCNYYTLTMALDL
eukprot:10910-Heterococcus_DN1.PRE.2